MKGQKTGFTQQKSRKQVPAKQQLSFWKVKGDPVSNHFQSCWKVFLFLITVKSIQNRSLSGGKQGFRHIRLYFSFTEFIWDLRLTAFFTYPSKCSFYDLSTTFRASGINICCLVFQRCVFFERYFIIYGVSVINLFFKDQCCLKFCPVLFYKSGNWSYLFFTKQGSYLVLCQHLPTYFTN